MLPPSEWILAVKSAGSEFLYRFTDERAARDLARKLREKGYDAAVEPLRAERLPV